MNGDVFELVGKVISFQYPSSNYECARKRLERRRLRVDRVRDTEAFPLTVEEITADPDLRRSRYLIMGLDIDKAEPRSFYDASMEELEVIDLPRCQVFIFPVETAIHVYDAAFAAEAKGYADEFNSTEPQNPTGYAAFADVYKICQRNPAA